MQKCPAKMGEYDDIINMPHHVSKRHPQMPMMRRAAQFAPFAAVAGYKEEIEKANREHVAKYEKRDILTGYEGA